MVSNKVAESATTEWTSPAVFAAKNDDSLWFCVDYRRLNATTVRDSHPILKMDECIDVLGTVVLLSALDANSVYRLIEMEEKDMNKAAFVTHNGL